MATAFDLLNAVAALEKPEGVIAFPTDTVYGIGALPSNIKAVEKIFRLKGRSSEKPLILMGYSSEALRPFVGKLSLQQENSFRELAKNYWPGALTLVLPKSDLVKAEITGGFDTVGLRVPDSPLLRELFSMVNGGVLATTSANLSNQKECLSAAEVFETFGRNIDFILMDDLSSSGQPSTVAAIEPDGSIAVLREGAIVLD